MKEIFEKRQCLSQDEIMGYINSSLPEKELYEIEKHLVDCALCNAAVEGWLKVEEPTQVLNELDNLKIPGLNDKDIRQPKKERQLLIGVKPLIATAASIALILAILFLLPKPKGNTAAIYETNYEYLKMPDPTTRNADETRIKELTKNAWQAYNEKDFQASADIFDQLLKLDGKNPTALLFGGLSHLETGQLEKAIKTLDKLSSQSDTQYAEDANWYLALALLRNNDIERCREVSEFIASQQGFYAAQASKLVRKLEKL
ncbi:MAG: tetratricopeptide repeat protein [Bacteroidota bacterium]